MKSNGEKLSLFTIKKSYQQESIPVGYVLPAFLVPDGAGGGGLPNPLPPVGG